MRTLSKLAAAGIAVALAAGALAGCSSSAREQRIAAGDVSNAVSVADYSSDRSSITGRTDLSTDSPQLTIGSRGDGRWFDPDTDAVQLSISYFRLDTGESLGDATTLSPATADGIASLGLSTVYEPLSEALDGLRAGDVFTLVIPGVELTDTTTSIVIIGSVDDVFLARAHGAEQAPVAGFPQVVRATNGQPGLVLDSSYSSDDAPASAVLIKGDGDQVVQDDDVVYMQIVQYDTTVAKRSSMVINSTWETGQLGGEHVGDSSNEITAAIDDAIRGLPVGSQVIMHIPAAADAGYGDLFVVDVLQIVAKTE